ncbi:MAG: DUF3667 domain-containing protein [Flavisolibacter sp.]
MQITPVTPNTCKNCNNRFVGNYCNECGEKVYTEKDKHVSSFFEEGFHFITHFEGKFFRTIKTLFSRPGQVSLDYSNGIRKKYFKLLSLFLLLVLLYLIFPVFEGLNMKLYYHEEHNIYGGYAKNQVREIMLDKDLTEKQVSDLFQKKSEKISKTFLVLILPLTAIATWAVSFKRRKYFFDQLVISTEFNSMYLLWGFLTLPLILMLVEIVYKKFSGNILQLGEGITGLMVAIPMFVFLAIASKRFYGYPIWRSILFALFFMIAHTFIVHYLYKFILFATVINLIK